MNKDKKTIKINPWGITGGLFSSVLAVLVLVIAYWNEGVDKYDVIIISAIILANGFLSSLSREHGIEATKLLDESMLVVKQQSELAVRGWDAVSMLSKNTKVQEELIAALKEKVAIQQKHIEALGEQVNA